jgi:hypothetical protein
MPTPRRRRHFAALRSLETKHLQDLIQWGGLVSGSEKRRTSVSEWVGAGIRHAQEWYRKGGECAFRSFGDAFHEVMPRGRGGRLVGPQHFCFCRREGCLGELRQVGQNLATTAGWQRQYEKCENEG